MLPRGFARFDLLTRLVARGSSTPTFANVTPRRGANAGVVPPDDRLHETGIDDKPESMELEICLRIPRLRRYDRGVISWQHGGGA
jgi:hypothetical protein